MENLTGRKDIEIALHESEERQRLAVEAAHLGTYEWNVVEDILIWSQRHEELFGYAPGEFGGAYQDFAVRVHAGDLRVTEAEIARCIAARVGYAGEFRVIWPDGSVHWVASTGEFTFDSDGRPLRMYGVVMETTERKQAEQKLAASRDQLRALLARLQQAREEERVRVSREIHDELGQLLTSLKMDVRWLEQRLSGLDLPPALNPLLDRAVSASELADATIATVQKIAAKLRPGALDHLGLAAALGQEARRYEERSGVRCAFFEDGTWTPLPVEIESELFYIAQEALTNVARHADAKRVDIFLRSEGDEAVLEVRDDGVGISKSDLAVSASLGLLGMEERAAQCGGEIHFTHNEPQGTRVTVRIPHAGNRRDNA